MRRKSTQIIKRQQSVPAPSGVAEYTNVETSKSNNSSSNTKGTSKSRHSYKIEFFDLKRRASAETSKITDFRPYFSFFNRNHSKRRDSS